MRFLADMGIAAGVVSWLRSHEHDAVHLRDEGLQKLPNGLIFAKAAADNRIIPTFDLDFGEIIALSGGKSVSVVLFRLNNATTPFVIGRLEAILPPTTEALSAGAIDVVEDSRYRVRRLPLGN
jgi:predicted nuclease of predicted toxin-antitoxin system